MDNSMMTGNYLLEVLNDQEELISVLGEGKIFPLVAKEDTTFPFVIYTRDNLNVQYTKVVGHDNIVNITYRVYSDNYDEAITIANIIRNILERKNINIPNIIKINDIRITNMYEQFTENGFCEAITFQTYVE